MNNIGDIMEYNEEIEKLNKKKKRNAKELYWKNRESHLKAQKKYDDKNRNKKHEYDKKRWQQTKLNNEIVKKLKEYVLENSYLDLAENRCWVNKHSAEDIMNILESEVK
jgi:phosphoribosylaminoimidazole-succinocarboxamide synthase